MSSSRPWRPARQLLGLPAYHARLAGLAFRSTNNHHHPCHRHLSRADHAGHGPSSPASARPLSARPLLGRPGPSPLPRTRPLRLRPAALSQTLPKVRPLLRLILPWPTPSQCGTFFSHFLLLLLGSRACPCADDPSRRLRLQRLLRDAATLVTLPVPSPAQTRTVLCSPTPLLSRPADSWICRLRPTLASSPPAHECQPGPSLWHLPFRRCRILSCCGHLRSLFLRRLPFLFLLSPRRHPRDCVCALPLARERSPHFPRGHSTLVPTSFACTVATLVASSPTSTSTLHLPYNFRHVHAYLASCRQLCRRLPARKLPFPSTRPRPQSLLQDAGVAERHTLF